MAPVPQTVALAPTPATCAKCGGAATIYPYPVPRGTCVCDTCSPTWLKAQLEDLYRRGVHGDPQLRPSSRPKRRQVECGEKKRYTSEGAARRAMRLMDDRDRDEGYKGRARPYWCRQHRGWHVGHE